MLEAGTGNDVINLLIDEIVDCELNMFVAVSSADGPADCQQRPETFRIMRWMAHCRHKEPTLRAWLADLRRAESENRNLMTEKYAIMDGQLKPTNPRPLCNQIASAESAFMLEASKRYPHVITMATNGKGFEWYLLAELQTWSDEALKLYAEEVTEARQEGRNLAVERFDQLWHRLGLGSLEDREALLAAERTTLS